MGDRFADDVYDIKKRFRIAQIERKLREIEEHSQYRMTMLDARHEMQREQEALNNYIRSKRVA
jgi:hypothetical protein